MDETIGKKIMRHRKRLGLTQDQLAEQLGVTAQAVSKWENDQSCPDISVIPRLADIFGVTTDALLGRTEEAPVYEAEVVTDAGDDRRFQMNWYGGRRSAVVFGIQIIAVGVLYLLSHLFSWNISFGTLLWTTFLLVFGLAGVYPRFSCFRLGCALVGGFFLISRILPLPQALGSTAVVSAVIILFGVSLLLDALKKPKKPSFQVSCKGKQKYDYTCGADSFRYAASFGANRQKVELPTLSRGQISTSFGEYCLDLSGVKSLTPDAVLHADCSFGELTVLVPRRYQVKTASATAFASFDVDGSPDENTAGLLRLDAKVSFGEMRIRYI